jgi:hypothetical protein
MSPNTRFLKVIALTTGIALCLIPLVRTQAARTAPSAKVQRTATTAEIPITAPEKLTTGDFNNDNYPDLVVSSIDSTNRYVTVFISDGTGGYLPPNQFTLEPVSGTSASYSVLAKDFTNDGKADLAVVCFGLASPFGGSLGATVKFYQGDGLGGFAAPTTTGSLGGVAGVHISIMWRSGT